MTAAKAKKLPITDPRFPFLELASKLYDRYRTVYMGQTGKEFAIYDALLDSGSAGLRHSLLRDIEVNLQWADTEFAKSLNSPRVKPVAPIMINLLSLWLKTIRRGLAEGWLIPLDPEPVVVAEKSKT